MTLDIPQSIKDQFPPLESTDSKGSESQGGKGSQPQQSAKIQEEIDVERFEKEADDSGLDLDLDDLLISEPRSSEHRDADDSGFVT